MLSKPVLYYGSEDPLPERIPLQAGPLHLVYEQGDLRGICLGEREILRRVYVAVRDRNWGTVPPLISNQVVQVEKDAFHINYAVDHRLDDIHFTWQAAIHGDADGALTFSMQGAAQSTFLKNRIGFCVLFPAGSAGAEAEIEHIGRSKENTRFPVDICADQPVPPFGDMRALAYPIEPDVWVEVRFEGDTFEMEDQRLWTDASYKVFCTPLNLPYPVEIQAGTRVAQTIAIAIRGQPAARRVKKIHPQASSDPEPVRLRLARDVEWKPIPQIGLGMAYHAKPLSNLEVERLKGLHLHHLRVDLRLVESAYPDRLRLAMREAALLDIALETALLVTAEDAQAELHELRRLIDDLGPPVGSWLVYPAQELYQGGTPTRQVLQTARQLLHGYNPALTFAAGTNTDYIFLKRTPPPVDLMQRVCIALHPQVHAFDNQSLVETLETQPLLVESARRLAQGLPVTVSPITLKPRFNPYVTGAVPRLPPGRLPPEVDARQASLFGAGWTLGSLRAMLAAPVSSVTYYETTGLRGVMAGEKACPFPQAFPSIPGAVFPLFHVLADVGEFSGGHGAALSSSSALRASGFALRKGEGARILLANHTPDELRVIIEGPAGSYAAGFLDETNAEEAMRQPTAFRCRARDCVGCSGSKLELRLRPFGLACLDAGQL